MGYFDKDEQHGAAPLDRMQSDIAPRRSEQDNFGDAGDDFALFDVNAPDSGRWLDPLVLTKPLEHKDNEAVPPSGFKRSAPAPLPRLSFRAGVAPSIRFSRPQPLLSQPPRTQGALHPLDEVLLDALHHAFSLHAGESENLDVQKLQSILDLKNPLLAQRLLKVFDRDGDGIISRDEFLERVRRLIYGSQTDKLLFAFRLHDINGDGKVDRSEVLAMIQTSMAEENTLALAQTPDELADLLMAEADVNGDGYLSYREFEGVLTRHPTILDMMTRCEATWIAPGVDLKPRPNARRPGWLSVLRLVQNQRAALVVISVWLSVNVALAARAVWVYHQAGANTYVLIARACGACINFNGALILVPVMRRLLTRVRSSRWLGKLPVDDAIQFHRLVGHTLFGLSLVHAAAHLLNYRLQGGVQQRLWGTSAGITGLCLLVVFALMWGMSLPFVRRSSRFELFHFTHLFYVAWFGLCLLHGPVFYLWATVPLVAFMVEQGLRVARRGAPTEITALTPLSSGVTRLDIARPASFQFQAGDYAFLRIPSLARHEWHPFTISSAPENDHLTMHVRSLGDFTRSLRVLGERNQAEGALASVAAYLDGPYGTASGRIFESEVAVLVGAGIGVTPFASVLESLVLRARTRQRVPNKVHFYWLNRDPYSFEWFAKLLLELESIDIDHIVDVEIYLTDGRGHATSAALNLARAIGHHHGQRDFITGLRAKTNLGRPDWSDELARLKRLHPTERVDLFFCGPPGLGAGIKRVCKEQQLGFHQEVF